MSNRYVSRALYAVAVIANFILTAFAIQLGAGKVPIPDAWQWTVPIISAAITAALMFLPRAGSESVAIQEDHLRASGVPRSHMILQDAGTKREAERAVRHAEAANAGEDVPAVDHEAKPERAG